MSFGDTSQTPGSHIMAAAFHKNTKYYEILGVTPAASVAEIKAGTINRQYCALLCFPLDIVVNYLSDINFLELIFIAGYRKMAMTWHADKNADPKASDRVCFARTIFFQDLIRTYSVQRNICRL